MSDEINNNNATASPSSDSHGGAFAFKEVIHIMPEKNEFTTITTYKQLGDLVGTFADGKFSLLVILGRPGLGKSQALQAATKDKDCLYLRGGRVTPHRFFHRLFEFKDYPVVIDDADDLLNDRLGSVMVRCLTETDDEKLIEWDTKQSAQGISSFVTKSATCIITNSWKSGAVYDAIENRAIFRYFEPSNEEVLGQCRTWFDDDEIVKYVDMCLPDIQSLDCRTLVKARQIKMAGLPAREWQAEIEAQTNPERSIVRRTGYTSGYNGVSYHRIQGKWIARLDNGQVGSAMTTEDEAALAYNAAAKAKYGDKAHLNVIGQYVRPVSLLPQRRQKTSVYRGVTKNKRGWQVSCGSRVIGRYESEEQAALAYNKAAKEKYGDRARLNKVEGTLIEKPRRYRGVSLSNGSWQVYAGQKYRTIRVFYGYRLNPPQWK